MRKRMEKLAAKLNNQMSLTENTYMTERHISIFCAGQ